MVPAMLQWFLWKIWAQYHQLAEDLVINMLRTCAKSRSSRQSFVRSKSNIKPRVSQRPLSSFVILHSGEMAQGFLRQGITLFLLVLLVP